MSELGASGVAREDVEALAEVLRGCGFWGTHADRWNDADWQERFWTTLAEAILASSWLADFAEKVRVAERERLAAEGEVLADRLGALADDSHVAPDDWNAGWRQGMHEAAKMARGDD